MRPTTPRRESQLERQLARYRRHILWLPAAERERYRHFLDTVDSLLELLRPHRLAS